jgi:hypothetical protein
MAKTTTIVELSEGHEVEVRRMGIFELDAFDPDPLGPFTYMGKTLAGEVEIEYDGSKWESPPKKPDVEDPEEGTQEWWDLREYEMYWAWNLHEQKRLAAAATFHERLAEHIMDTCLNGDRDKVVTLEDWEKVHTAAMVPQMTQEDVVDALHNTFPSYF